jgi:uncharacterized protein YdhG (YjbR/CyaY superfamily)
MGDFNRPHTTAGTENIRATVQVKIRPQLNKKISSKRSGYYDQASLVQLNPKQQHIQLDPEFRLDLVSPRSILSR